MQLHVNGQEMTFAHSLTAEGLLEAMDLKGKRVAMMVNEVVIRRDERPTLQLAEGDRVEIISMVGGG